MISACVFQVFIATTLTVMFYCSWKTKDCRHCEALSTSWWQGAEQEYAFTPHTILAGFEVFKNRVLYILGKKDVSTFTQSFTGLTSED